MPRGSERSGSRSALLVATANYSDAVLNQLRSPARDAADMALVLADPGIGGFAVSQVSDRTDYEIKQAVVTFLDDRSVDDLVVVYLSCHGVRDAYGRLYFAATNTQKSKLKATAVESAWLLDVLDECRARQQVLILDCCFSGAFARTKSLAEIGLERRFATSGRGRVVLTASRAEEYSYEGKPLAPGAVAASMFTAGLVDGLSSGAADRDRDGLITVEEAFRHAVEHVHIHGGTQSPQHWVYGGESPIVLARNPHVRIATPAPASATSHFIDIASARAGVIAATLPNAIQEDPADLLLSGDERISLVPVGNSDPSESHFPVGLAGRRMAHLRIRRHRKALAGVAAAAVVMVIVVGIFIAGQQTWINLLQGHVTLPFPRPMQPRAIGVDNSGTVYVADARTDRILRLAKGSTTPTVLPFAGLIDVSGMTVDPSGDVYVADYRKRRVLELAAGSTTPQVVWDNISDLLDIAVDPVGTLHILQGTADSPAMAPDASGIAAYALHPYRMLRLSKDHRRKDAATVEMDPDVRPTAMAADTSGDIYLAEGNRVLRFPQGASTGQDLPFTGLQGVCGMAVTRDGIYITDQESKRVLRMSPGLSSANELPFRNLDMPWGMAVDTSGHVYVATTGPDHKSGTVLKSIGSM